MSKAVGTFSKTQHLRMAKALNPFMPQNAAAVTKAAAPVIAAAPAKTPQPFPQRHQCQQPPVAPAAPQQRSSWPTTPQP